jgi:hypothetical protein
MAEEKNNYMLPLVAIVAIVAIVGLVIMILNIGPTMKASAAVSAVAGNNAGNAVASSFDCWDLSGASYMDEATCKRFCTTNNMQWTGYATESKFCCCN